MGQQGSKGGTGNGGGGGSEEGIPTMKAWVATAPSTNVHTLQNVQLLTNVPIPTPTSTQVRVKIFSASLNRVDLGRAVTTVCTFPAILGTDGAGIVDQLGCDAAYAASKYNIAVGDRVYFHIDLSKGAGTLAEYCVVELAALTKLDLPTAAADGEVVSANNSSISNPEALTISFNEAATLPSAAWTAFIALFDKLKIEPGRVIFIDGAAGGVGSYAVQFCKMMGLFVIGTCATYNVEYLREMGVDIVVDFVMDDVSDKLREWTRSRGVDYFLELVSPEQGERYVKHIRFGGSMCLVGGAIRNPLCQEVLFQNQISVHYVNLNGLHRDHDGGNSNNKKNTATKTKQNGASYEGAGAEGKAAISEAIAEVKEDEAAEEATSSSTLPLLNYLGTQCLQMILVQKSIRPCYHEVIPFEQAKDALMQMSNGHGKGKIVLRVVDTAALRRQQLQKEKEKMKEEGGSSSGDILRTTSTSSATARPPPPPPILKPESPNDEAFRSTTSGDAGVVTA